MTAIAGIGAPSQNVLVDKMLQRMDHRGSAGHAIRSNDQATLGLAWSHLQIDAAQQFEQKFVVQDQPGYGNFARAEGEALRLKRGPFGVSPLYYGMTRDGLLGFASEMKGLLAITRDVHLLPPGHIYANGQLEAYFTLKRQPPLADSPEIISHELRRRLEVAVERRVGYGNVGAWLSGGLDSSVMAALARPHVQQFHTFAVGLPDAPDLKYAREAAQFLRTNHHEKVVELVDMVKALPEVIYYLESFDALLVRSSVMNYLVAQLASQYVSAVFSGEGGDELFAGYEYLKGLDRARLPDELIDITLRLHNTALQRVDRCATAHETVAYVGFLDPDVVNYALRIPAEYKLRDGVEKWILRQAMVGALPDRVLWRPKAKFWEGSGVGELLARYAEACVSDADFKVDRRLPNGWVLNSKEELFYYRIFSQHFGEFDDLSWMGRTKGAPVS